MIETVAGLASELDTLGRVVVAMVLGGLIGLERETTNKPAGLRTHMLVSGVAALLVGLGPTLVERYGEDVGAVRSDPIRIIEAVITGVSFLGAGTIIRSRPAGDVRGLTTAASVLFVAAVGIAVGLEEWVLAIGVTLVVVLTLRGVGVVERRWLH